MDDELQIKRIISDLEKESEEKLFFFHQGLGAEVHWFFSQAVQALKSELYLPACTSFLCGIEASLRITMAQVETPTRIMQLDASKLLSNRLLKVAYEKNLPIETLAFPNEDDFLAKLFESDRLKKVNVEIVRTRHNLCHGNILEFVNTNLGEDFAFFTPECCRELALTLYDISKKWAYELGMFRTSRLKEINKF